MKVIVDRARHAALLVKQGNKWVHILRATGRGLVAEKLTEDELTADWSELTNQTVNQAIGTFTGIARAKGGTKAAVTLLGEAIVELETENA
jgi:hypothetical protein